MGKQAKDPRNKVDALVQAYLVQQIEHADATVGLARVKAGLRHQAPKARPRRIRPRLLWAAVVAAALIVSFVSGWYLSPVQAGARELVQEAKRVHGLPLARCYLDTLLADFLHDCTLTEASSVGAPLTRVVTAEPRSERTRLWLGQATLEIDTEAKVLRRLNIGRRLLGRPHATVTFTLIETRPDDDAKYQLEGHLAEPVRIYEGPLEPRIKLELLGRVLEVRKETRGTRDEGRAGTPADSAAGVFKDVNGQQHTPLAPSKSKATILFFLMPDCPIANSYAPEIKRICADYDAKKINAFIVHADPDVTADQARQHARQYGLACPVLLDPTHVLVKKTGVTRAPEVAVLAPDRKVLYRGRIDDWYVDYGKRRGEPTQRDLRNALDAILQGKAVPVPTTKAIGCYLPEPKQ